MKLWSKALLGAALVLALPLGATAVWGGNDPGSPASSLRAQRVQTIDISGPCDEAENQDDPRCDDVDLGDALSTASPSPSSTASPSPSPSASDDDDDDISGPCDEAEHANDPRCTGGERTDNSGPGSMDDVEAREEDDDLDEVDDDDDGDDDTDDTDDVETDDTGTDDDDDDGDEDRSGSNSGPG